MSIKDWNNLKLSCGLHKVKMSAHILFTLSVKQVFCFLKEIVGLEVGNFCQSGDIVSLCMFPANIVTVRYTFLCKLLYKL